MTPTPPTPNPGDRRPLLAGLADGELGASAARRVEGWLDADPRAQDVLADQVSLSPAGTDLWEATRPESPPDAVWAAVGRTVARRVTDVRSAARTRRRGRALVGGVAAAIGGLAVWAAGEPTTAHGAGRAVAARKAPAGDSPATPPAVVVVAPMPRLVPPVRDLLAEYAVLPMAHDAEVRIDSFTQAPRKSHDIVMNVTPGDTPMIFPVPRP